MKKTKFILPTIAFLIATGAAVVTAQTITAKILVSVPVSLAPPYPCQQIGTCTLGGTTLCRTPGGTLVVQFFPATSTCGGPVYGIWDED
jgi:hypothetical protein